MLRFLGHKKYAFLIRSTIVVLIVTLALSQLYTKGPSPEPAIDLAEETARRLKLETQKIQVPEDVITYPEPTDPRELQRSYASMDFHQGKSSSTEEKDAVDRRNVIARGNVVRKSNRQVLITKLTKLILDCKPNVEILQDLKVDADTLAEGLLTLTKEELSRHLTVDQQYIDLLKQSYHKFLKQFEETLGTIDLTSLYRGRSVVMLYDEKSTRHFLDFNVWLHLKLKLGLPVEMVARKLDHPLCSNSKKISSCHNISDFIFESELPLLNPHNSVLFFDILSLLATEATEKIYSSPGSSLLINPLQFRLASGPFQPNKLILWPNFAAGSRRRVTHPAFYDLVGAKMGERTRYGFDDLLNRDQLKVVTPANALTALHDHEGTIPELYTTTEALVIDTRHHFRTLAVALYLLAYEDWWSPLVMQSTETQSKEIFRADVIKIAAYITGNGLYTVKMPLASFKLDSEASAFVDPSLDLRIGQLYQKQMAGLDDATLASYKNENFIANLVKEFGRKLRSYAFVVHASEALDPYSKTPEELYYDKILRARHRLVGNDALVSAITDFDYELEYFKMLFEENACDVAIKNKVVHRSSGSWFGWFGSKEETEDKPRVKESLDMIDCEEMKMHIRFLKNHPPRASSSGKMQ